MLSETPTYAVDFADGITEQLSLTPLGTGHYRAEQSSLADDSVNFGDIIAAERVAEITVHDTEMVDFQEGRRICWTDRIPGASDRSGWLLGTRSGRRVDSTPASDTKLRRGARVQTSGRIIRL